MQWAHGKVNLTLVHWRTTVQVPHGDHGQADHSIDRWRWGRPGSRGSCDGGSHATLPPRKGEYQEIQTVGRLDAENKMTFNKLNTNKQHIRFIRSCVAAEL